MYYIMALYFLANTTIRLKFITRPSLVRMCLSLRYSFRPFRLLFVLKFDICRLIIIRCFWKNTFSKKFYVSVRRNTVCFIYIFIFAINNVYAHLIWDFKCKIVTWYLQTSRVYLQFQFKNVNRMGCLPFISFDFEPLNKLQLHRRRSFYSYKHT